MDQKDKLADLTFQMARNHNIKRRYDDSYRESSQAAIKHQNNVRSITTALIRNIATFTTGTRDGHWIYLLARGSPSEQENENN